MSENYFVKLNSINVNDKTEKKNGLTYLSWAWAWAEVKKLYPDATYTIYEDANGRFYHTDGNTCWVKTGVTVNGIENIEYLPVMDFRNASIPVGKVTSFDVNKAVQRSLTKAVARHGLGLYIYAGEDLPESDDGDDAEKQSKPAKDTKKAAVPAIKEEKAAIPDEAEMKKWNETHKCAKCGRLIMPYKGKSGKQVSVDEHIAACAKQFGKVFCVDCIGEMRNANG